MYVDYVSPTLFELFCLVVWRWDPSLTLTLKNNLLKHLDLGLGGEAVVDRDQDSLGSDLSSG